MPTSKQETWIQICADKRAQREAAIPLRFRLPDCTLSALPVDADVRRIAYTCGLMSDDQLAITEISDAADLVAQIAAGKVSVESVTEAYCARAAIAHQLTGCLSEILFERAAKRAKVLDAHLARTGRTVGPLHGLPISLKDQFYIVGVDSTIGFASRAFQPSSHNSVLVDMLESLGAVIHCKTNVPTALMAAETNSNVLGRTLNPFNLSLTSGGSSGGEGALVAMHGSILGVGTDYGGSIRVPASNCGLYGLRPTTLRLPYQGVANVAKGAEGIISVIGPLARSLDSVSYFMKAVIDAEPWLHDPRVVERPWSISAGTRKLRIGVIWENGQVRTLAPVRRALSLAVGKLRCAGHEVLDFAPVSFAVSAAMFPLFSAADGGQEISSLLQASGEQLVPEVFDFSKSSKVLSVPEYCALVQRRDACRFQFHQEWLRTDEGSGPLDLILCPTSPEAPARHRGSPSPSETISFTTVWSVLDLPCLVLPVSFVQPEDVSPTLEEPLCAIDAELSQACTYPYTQG